MMKIFGFSQRKLIDFGLDNQDAAILRYLSENVQNDNLVFVDYEEILKDMPILRITTADALQRKIKQYENLQLLIPLDKNVVVEILKNKHLDNKGFGNKQCQWCKCKTTILHKHHHPIKKSDGGKEVVHICSNCHNEFHYSNYYLLSLEALKDI